MLCRSGGAAALSELLLRFLIGAALVAAFSFIGCLFTPKSFAGLFGAAPSIALATLVLTVSKNGKDYAATEAHSMMGGAIAFFLYASVVSSILMSKKFSALQTTMAAMAVWFGSAFALWLVWLR
jgi:uncharacterized membrane protein (GlpM family)